jgi:hypothetical protein
LGGFYIPVRFVSNEGGIHMGRSETEITIEVYQYKTPTMDLIIRPLTSDLWPALEDLFGEHGAVNGCWCMY